MRNTLVLLAAAAFAATACSPAADPPPVKPATPLIAAIPIKLEVTPDPAKLYRLVVLFYQFDDDYKMPPIDVALDIPFDPKATTIDLPTPSVPSAANILCERATKVRDELPGACDATAKFHAAISALAIVEDTNRDGKADFIYPCW